MTQISNLDKQLGPIPYTLTEEEQSNYTQQLKDIHQKQLSQIEFQFEMLVDYDSEYRTKQIREHVCREDIAASFVIGLQGKGLEANSLSNKMACLTRLQQIVEIFNEEDCVP